MINLLKVYPASLNAEINGSRKAQDFYPVNNGHQYSLQNNDTITVSGEAYFGINTYDPFNNGNNKNGVYKIKLFQDQMIIYEHDVETFSFEETRYINSFIDYKEYKEKQRRIQKSYIQPNNHLSIYKKSLNNGILVFSDEQVFEMTYEVSDFAGNVAKLKFFVKSLPLNPDLVQTNNEPDLQLFSFKKTNSFRNDKLQLEVPASALYDTLYFKYQSFPATPGSYSEVHQLHFDYVPLHTSCELSIKPDSMPDNLRNKALIARIDKDGKYWSAGGNWENGFVKASIRDFGNYCIVTDTLAPEIRPGNISNSKNISGQSTIKLVITDELSGIKSYRGTLNGKWILMEYDAKNDLLIYQIDDRLEAGENNFKLVVTDNKDNVKTYTARLNYTK
ncbi:MAG: hypothetical protein R2764_24045 [Bacteroidales bacterium]